MTSLYGDHSFTFLNVLSNLVMSGATENNETEQALEGFSWIIIITMAAPEHRIIAIIATYEGIFMGRMPSCNNATTFKVIILQGVYYSQT